MKGETVVLAIDPGRGKCGLAVVSRSGAAIERRVVARENLIAAAVETVTEYAPAAVVIGNRTGSRDARRELEAALHRSLVVVEEHQTTMHARDLYFEDHPRRGLARLMPHGLFTPPCPVDDYAAVLLGRRYWAGEPLQKRARHEG